MKNCINEVGVFYGTTASSDPWIQAASDGWASKLKHDRYGMIPDRIQVYQPLDIQSRYRKYHNIVLDQGVYLLHSLQDTQNKGVWC